jgi:hypothetical protein
MKPPEAYNYSQLSWFLQKGFFSAALRDIEASQSIAELTPEATLIKALALKGRGEIRQAHTLLSGLLDEPESVKTRSSLC